MMAFTYYWPPGSYDHLTIARASRLIETAKQLTKDQQTSMALRHG